MSHRLKSIGDGNVVGEAADDAEDVGDHVVVDDGNDDE